MTRPLPPPPAPPSLPPSQPLALARKFRATKGSQQTVERRQGEGRRGLRCGGAARETSPAENPTPATLRFLPRRTFSKRKSRRPRPQESAPPRTAPSSPQRRGKRTTSPPPRRSTPEPRSPSPPPHPPLLQSQVREREVCVWVRRSSPPLPRPRPTATGGRPRTPLHTKHESPLAQQSSGKQQQRRLVETAVK